MNEEVNNLDHHPHHDRNFSLDEESKLAQKFSFRDHDNTF